MIKVARQYLYASEDPNITDIKDFRVERLDRKTGSANDWNNHTQGYHSEDEYKEHLYRIELAGKIRTVFGREHCINVPNITTAELRGIAKTLGLNFENCNGNRVRFSPVRTEHTDKRQKIIKGSFSRTRAIFSWGKPQRLSTPARAIKALKTP